LGRRQHLRASIRSTSRALRLHVRGALIKHFSFNAAPADISI
jgi:hypothetical protein